MLRLPGWLRPVAVVLVLALLVTWLHFYLLQREVPGGWSVPVDDTYIHFQYARGLAEGHPFAYHAGDGYSTGCTSPLYVVLLSVPYALGLKGLRMVPLTLVLGGVWLAATMLLLMRIGRQLGSAPAGQAAAAIWGCWGFTWYCLYCGMETGLWITMVLAVLSLFTGWTRSGDGRPSVALVLVTGLLPVTRPEGLALMGVVLLVVLYRLARRRRPGRLRVLLGWAPALLPGLAYYLANRLLTGTFSTSGMISKSLMHAPYFTQFKRGWQYATQLFESGQHFLNGTDPEFLCLALALPGMVALLALALREGSRKVAGPYLVMGLWMVALLLFASMHYIRIARWVRYYLPLFVMLTLGAGFALSWAAQLLRRPWLVAAAAMVIVFYQGDATMRWLKTYRSDVRVIDGKQASAARAAMGLPRDARLLVCDAGAIPYISGRWTFDIVGLTSPVRYNYFRNGGGSRFELFERIPREKRPTHVAAYDFCLWPGARGAVMSMHHDLVIAPVEEQGAETGHRPLSPPPAGQTLVDRVDVADLQSEDEHRYSLSNWGTISDNILHRGAGPDPGRGTVVDGARLVSGIERFTFSARPGRDVTLIGRYTVGLNVDLRVQLGGRQLKKKLTPTPHDGWSEVTFTLPRAVIKAQNELTVDSANGAAFHSYQYFVYQKKI